jgi:hypothetical protein
MANKTRAGRPHWAFLRGVCGQKTTVFVTAAQWLVLRRSASPVLLSGALLLFGCASSVTATPINHPPRPLVARDPSSVLVLASEPPSEPHVDVALLQVDQYEAYNPQGMAEMIQRLREKAAEIGCDAVYIKNTAQHKGDDLFLDPDSRQLLASCVVFTPPDTSREVEAEIADTQKRGVR